MNLWNAVNPPMRATFRVVARLNLIRAPRYVFILGHVRSGSTLLSHILASHPQMAGAGETHISYRTPADLPELVLKTCQFLHKPILCEPYVVDQINHAYLTDDVLLSDQVYKCIFLLREPEATIKSLMKLSKIPETTALEHYIARLETLAHYGSLLGARAILVEYDDLVDHTERTLAALTRFLGLSSPLKPTYENHRMTAREFGFGDTSTNIKVGRIIRTANHEITLGKDVLAAAERAFEKCRASLLATAIPAAKVPVRAGDGESMPALSQ